jgi:hypothetical protein
MPRLARAVPVPAEVKFDDAERTVESASAPGDASTVDTRKHPRTDILIYIVGRTTRRNLISIVGRTTRRNAHQRTGVLGIARIR